MTDTRRARKLSRDLDVFREEVRGFAEESLKPVADRTDREARFNAEAFEEMASMGLLGVIFLEEYGGMGGSARCRTPCHRSKPQPPRRHK
jgi:alkylation response protein AidB-like acyl-CoA dehydrogenase